MPLSDHYRGGATERVLAQIITVDPGAGRIEVVGRDAAVISIGIDRVPPFFRWPVQGEYWTIARQNGIWTLEEYVEDPGSAKRARLLMPGEALVQAETIWTPSGERVLTTNDGLDERLDALEAPPVVTSLPVTNLFNGREVIYRVPSTALLWRFRYDTSIGDAQKWVYIGGGLRANDVYINLTNVTRAAVWVLAPLGTAANITVPLRGYYNARFWVGCFGANGSTAVSGGVSDVADSGSNVIAGMRHTANVDAGEYGMTGAEGVTTLQQAGVVLTPAVAHNSTANWVTYEYLHFDITPVRVG